MDNKDCKYSQIDEQGCFDCEFNIEDCGGCEGFTKMVWIDTHEMMK